MFNVCYVANSLYAPKFSPLIHNPNSQMAFPHLVLEIALQKLLWFSTTEYLRIGASFQIFFLPDAKKLLRLQFLIFSCYSLVRREIYCGKSPIFSGNFPLWAFFNNLLKPSPKSCREVAKKKV